ncbi:MAG: 50S ribosomal protein L30 [Bacteroidales bacterium]|nr:50S ribosomal protein L30 [Bacteroidales bacterium]
MSKIKITQVKSVIGAPASQRKVLAALGIKKMHQTVEHEDTPSVQGMITKVKHLVSVEK